MLTTTLSPQKIRWETECPVTVGQRLLLSVELRFQVEFWSPAPKSSPPSNHSKTRAIGRSLSDGRNKLQPNNCLCPHSKKGPSCFPGHLRSCVPVWKKIETIFGTDDPVVRLAGAGVNVLSHQQDVAKNKSDSLMDEELYFQFIEMAEKCLYEALNVLLEEYRGDQEGPEPNPKLKENVGGKIYRIKNFIAFMAVGHTNLSSLLFLNDTPRIRGWISRLRACKMKETTIKHYVLSVAQFISYVKAPSNCRLSRQMIVTMHKTNQAFGPAQERAGRWAGRQVLFLYLHAQSLQKFEQLLPGAVGGDELARVPDLHRHPELHRHSCEERAHCRRQAQDISVHVPRHQNRRQVLRNKSEPQAGLGAPASVRARWRGPSCPRSSRSPSASTPGGRQPSPESVLEKRNRQLTRPAPSPLKAAPVQREKTSSGVPYGL
ncbi:uncharacterized protein LOC127620061 [Xyrauchen texanus]|uniref:uncharacterized protein LOC127620061 n=1 Tax=Xyrauchen texanus TaxID=154827 RepID=UPI002241B7DD|nr:uncharacterized protein LOC127620061 [Xyrauchen texanus]